MENHLKEMLELSQQQNPDKLKFTEEEATKFHKAFEDEEFRKLFSEYMDELQDPKNREETETYISQLEGEQKLPEGKELIRPEPSFVAKTHKKLSETVKEKEKVFLNIVYSDKITKPSQESTPKGVCWSLPYSLGPPHMEKDKSGENAAAFDCCFHPDAIRLSKSNIKFQDLLVQTAMEGVEAMYKSQRQNVTLNKDYHVLKGVSYKEGKVPSMMISSANKQNWEEKTESTAPSSKAIATGSKIAAVATNSSTETNKVGSDATSQRPQADSTDAKLSAVNDAKGAKKSEKIPAIKKGFLNNSKKSIYGDKPGSTVSKGNSNGLIKEISSADAEMIKAATAIKKAATPAAPLTENSDVASIKPEAEKDLMKVRSITRTAPKGDDASASETSSTLVPIYTVKERGNIGMGDFEAMKAKVASNRPSELVYTFEVPKVLKSSQLVLDVSERTIKLSYLDVYALSLTLPYPVFDNKGAAKFDKTKKTLTLTLPVRPAEIVSMNAEVVEVITEVNDDLSQQIPAKEEIVDASNTGKAHKKKDESSIHSRWVAKEESMEKSTEDLKKEIAEQTKLTMEQKHQPIAKPSFEKSSQKARVTFTDNVDSTTTKVSVAVENCDWTEDFYPSDVFSGRRNGYIFKNGIFGVGYYKDQQQILKNGTTPDVSTKQEISDTKIVSSFPFETRQTLQTVAILVQVPAILRETVRVEYTNRSVNVQFSVLLDVSGEAKAGTEETSTHYGALLEITADCYDGIIPEQCRYDVAAQNMVIVLMKKNEVYWEELKAGELLIAKEIPLSESIKTTYKKVEQQAEKASTISKALESTIAQLQFSKNDAIYDLD